jgi:hypothetical protein
MATVWLDTAALSELAIFSADYAARSAAKLQLITTLKNDMWLLLLTASFLMYYLLWCLEQAYFILG